MKLDSLSDKMLLALYAGVLVAIAVFAVGGWIVKSHFEASAFNRITGKSVSTWDAMFVELRVQEPAK